jgi:hypothetical protein
MRGFEACDWVAIIKSAQDSGLIHALDREVVSCAARARFRVRDWERKVAAMDARFPEAESAPKIYFTAHAALRAAETQFANVLAQLLLTPKTRSSSRTSAEEKFKSAAGAKAPNTSGKGVEGGGTSPGPEEDLLEEMENE